MPIGRLAPACKLARPSACGCRAGCAACAPRDNSPLLLTAFPSAPRLSPLPGARPARVRKHVIFALVQLKIDKQRDPERLKELCAILTMLLQASPALASSRWGRLVCMHASLPSGTEHSWLRTGWMWSQAALEVHRASLLRSAVAWLWCWLQAAPGQLPHSTCRACHCLFCSQGPRCTHPAGSRAPQGSADGGHQSAGATVPARRRPVPYGHIQVGSGGECAAPSNVLSSQQPASHHSNT